MIADIPALVTPLSEEIMAFAAEQCVSAELPAVLRMTQRLYPQATLDVSIDDDPEIANDRHLLIHVHNGDLSVEEAIQTRAEWIDGLFGCCPAPLVCLFGFRVE